MGKKMRKSRFWAFLGRKQYVIAGAIVIAAAVATTVIYSDHEQQQREQLEEELAQENTPEEAGLVAGKYGTDSTGIRSYSAGADRGDGKAGAESGRDDREYGSGAGGKRSGE